MLQDYPQDLKDKVTDNIKNNRHPMDTSSQKGAISCFIGNLPFSVGRCLQFLVTEKLCQYVNADFSDWMSQQLDEAAIKGIFEQYGPVVSVTIVKDNLNRSKGFGFVEVRRQLSTWLILGDFFLPYTVNAIIPSSRILCYGGPFSLSKCLISGGVDVLQCTDGGEGGWRGCHRSTGRQGH